MDRTGKIEKPLLRVFSKEEVRRPPFWFMRQAGRYLPEYRKVRKEAKNFLDFCYRPDLAVEVTLQPLRRFSMDAAILFSDILVIPDALGQEVSFYEGRGPVLEPIRSLKDVRRLRGERVIQHLEPVFEALRRLSREIPNQVALIGFAGAPWTVATYMVEGRGGTDFSTVRRWALKNPESFGTLIDLLVDVTTEYLINQIRNGAEVVQIFDSWAGILSHAEFQKWISAPIRRIVRGVTNVCPDTPIIGFPKGAGTRYLEFGEETGVDALGLDSEVPLDWVSATLQEKFVVQGNLDNLVLFTGGKTLETETKRILSSLSQGRFIFNLGHGVLPNTPIENVCRVAELVKNWN